METQIGDSASSAAPPLTGADITGAGAGAGAASGGGAAANDNSSTQGEAWESFEEFVQATTGATQAAPAAQGLPLQAAAPRTPSPAQADAAQPAVDPAIAAAGQPPGEEDDAKKYNLPEDHPLLNVVRELRTHKGTLEKDLGGMRKQLGVFNAIGGDKFFEQMQPFFSSAWNPKANAWDYAVAAGQLSGVHTPEAIGEALLEQIVSKPENFKYAIAKLTGRDDLTPERFKRLLEADKAGEITLPEENTGWMTADDKARADETRAREQSVAEREAAIERATKEREENDRKVRVEAATEEVNTTWANTAFSVIQEMGLTPTKQEFEKTPDIARAKQTLCMFLMNAASYSMVNNPQYQTAIGLAESLAPSVGFVSTPAAEVFRTQLGLALKQIQPLIAAANLGRVEAANRIASAPNDVTAAGAGAGNQGTQGGAGDNYGYTDAQWRAMTDDQRDTAFAAHLDARNRQAQIGATA